MNFKVKFDNAAMQKVLDKVEKLSNPLDQQTAKKIGADVLDEMKDGISRGKSPISGNGNFEAYRGTYRKRIQRYGYVHTEDGKFSKRLRPVNLEVSGKFLSALKATVTKVKSGYGVVIGFGDRKNQKIEEGHRKGANGQAERPVIPQGGEQFSRNIQEVYLDGINEKIASIAKEK